MLYDKGLSISRSRKVQIKPAHVLKGAEEKEAKAQSREYERRTHQQRRGAASAERARYNVAQEGLEAKLGKVGSRRKLLRKARTRMH